MRSKVRRGSGLCGSGSSADRLRGAGWCGSGRISGRARRRGHGRRGHWRRGGCGGAGAAGGPGAFGGQWLLDRGHAKQRGGAIHDLAGVHKDALGLPARFFPRCRGRHGLSSLIGDGCRPSVAPPWVGSAICYCPVSVRVMPVLSFLRDNERAKGWQGRSIGGLVRGCAAAECRQGKTLPKPGSHGSIRQSNAKRVILPAHCVSAAPPPLV